MEPVVLITSILRLLLVGAVYVLNALALIRLASRSPSCCVHVLTSAAVLLAGLLYLSSWAPYLVYSLTDGQWLLLGANHHCLLQHFVTSETGIVLLALLAVRVLYRYLVKVLKRPPPTARAASLATCLAWLGPQLVYDAISLMIDGGANHAQSYRFLDDVVELPGRKGGNGTSARSGYRVGFMVCMQSLDGSILSYFSWQYTVVVVPLGTLSLFCGLRLLLAKKETKDITKSPLEQADTTSVSADSLTIEEKQEGCYSSKLFPPPPPPYDLYFSSDLKDTHLEVCSGSKSSYRNLCERTCSRDTLIDMALYYNLVWLLLLRPLAVLHALYLQGGSSGGLDGASYIDIGSHLVLTFSCVFSPFSPRINLFQTLSCRDYNRLQGDSVPYVELEEAKKKDGKQQTIIETSGESFC